MSKQNITTFDFIKASSKKHDYFYNYDKSVYTKTSEKLIITCPIHGDFCQRAASHSKGAGCRECSKLKISKALTKTKEEFIEQSLKIHGFIYDYSDIEYINGDLKVNIACKKHGIFLQSPNIHLNGHGCSKCNRRLTTEDFIKKSFEKHKDFYSYEKSVYVTSKTKVIITCPLHGDFKQTPCDHLSGRGCNECGKNKVREAISFNTEEFIIKAIIKHSNRYDYSKVNYINNSTKIKIICNIHGEFQQIPNDHIGGHGCNSCSLDTSRHTTKSFIERAKVVHNDLYSYEKSNYLNGKSKITITCKIHGDFSKTASMHLFGQGCQTCSGGENRWTRSGYIKQAKQRKCIFYILRCFNKEEEFYKIGITSNSIKKRYNTKASLPYNYEIISEIHGEAGDIWDFELQEKRKLKEFNYQPLVPFEGSKTECFTRYII